MNYVEALYNKLRSSGNERYLKRFNHSLGVSVTCLNVAKENNLQLDEEKLLTLYQTLTKIKLIPKVTIAK